MVRSRVVVSNLDAVLSSAFEDWCRRRSLGPMAAVSEPEGFADLRDIDLCVVAAEGDASLCQRQIAQIRQAVPAVPVVVLARGLGVDEVVALVRSGVAEVIGLPAEPTEVVNRASSFLRADRSVDSPQALLGESEPMRRLQRDVRAVSCLDSTVLVTGETGVGKSVVARAIHCGSRRSGQPFVAADFASLTPSIIESELFGHEKGAFTGAVSRHLGRFERAGGGTIFLDEIGELPLELQGRLLRVLQDRVYERIGGAGTLHLEARVVAATNRDLNSGVRHGEFRADLLYRLNVYHIPVPPLRERRPDIPAMVGECLLDLSRHVGFAPPKLPPAVMAKLVEYHWPGNVRELRNVLERILIRHRLQILEGAEPTAREWSALVDVALGDSALLGGREASGCRTETAGPNERDEIIAALVDARGNVALASRALGVARSTLRYRIQRHRLSGILSARRQEH